MTNGPELEEKKNTLKGKPGATLLTFTGFMALGVLAGLLIASFTREDFGQRGPDGTTPLGFVLLLPLIIGVIQRTTSDKPVTWYRREAQIIGLVAGAVLYLGFS